jgi:hypothetical protein
LAISILPLVIEATSSTVDLSAWLASHRDEVETHLLESGGVLFRGFGVDSPQAFEKVICALSDRLLDYSYRSTPRTVVSGKVYTSTEYPPHQTIPLHNENAYARSWPMKIWFFQPSLCTLRRRDSDSRQPPRLSAHSCENSRAL